MKTTSKILGCFLAIAIALSASLPAFAAEGRKLLISPIESRITMLQPGQQQTGEYTVKNTGDVALTFDVRAEALDIQMPNYADVYGEPAMSSATLLANWISFPQTEWTLQPDQSTTVAYTINVPSGAAGGAQRAVIMNRMKSEGTVAVERQAAFKIFANISGNTRVNAKIAKVSIPAFLFRAPIKTKIDLTNDGNTDEWTEEKMTVKTLGGETVYEEENSHVVLAGKPRTVENRWDGAPGIGIFRVTQTVNLNGQEMDKSSLVFIVPLYLIIIVGLLLALLIGRIVISARNRKTRRVR